MQIESIVRITALSHFEFGLHRVDIDFGINGHVQTLGKNRNNTWINFLFFSHNLWIYVYVP